MKSNLLKVALVAIVGLAVCAPLTINAKKKADASAAQTDDGKFSGTVGSVDTAANTITVNSKKGDVTLKVTSSTTITKDKQPATLADVTMGAKVMGTSTKDAAGTKTATTLKVKSAK